MFVRRGKPSAIVAVGDDRSDINRQRSVTKHTMDYIIPAFKLVSVTFALLSAGSGLQAVFDPIGFSTQFGLPLSPPTTAGSRDGEHNTRAYRIEQGHYHSLAQSYASLLGVRSLGTGITVLVFAYQGKWTEVATILAIIGVVVAGSDGLFLARAGFGAKGRFHAIPGAGIAALAVGALYMGL